MSKNISRKNTRSTIALTISAIALALTACSVEPDTQSVQPQAPNSSVPESTEPASPQATIAPSAVTIPGVENPEEVTFVVVKENSKSGFFDALNNSGELNHTAAKSEPIVISGWAILPEQAKPADAVLITSGDARTLVAVAEVNVDRLDVAKSLNNPALQKSGWTATIDPSNLSGNEVILQAWAYNAATKEATLLNNFHKVIIK